jgi:predicted RNA polymerase sigma factor
MSPEDYRARIARLSLTQEAAGELFGFTGRTGQTWAAEGPPVAVAMILLAVGRDRAGLDRLRRHACNN